MTDRREHLALLLEELAEQPGVLGVSLVSRDGLGVRSAGKHDLQRETFSAMTATLMGASEIALAELDPGRTRFVLAQTDRAKIVIMGATLDLLLVVYASADAPLDPVLAASQRAAGSVAAVVAG